MSDNTAEVKESPKHFTRRRIVGAIGASAIAAPVVFGEIRKGDENELKTNLGTFIPLYENHITGISVDEIPNNVDGFFREYQPSGGIFSESAPQAAFEAIFVNTDGILNKLSSNEIPLVFGDVSIRWKELLVDRGLLLGEALVGLKILSDEIRSKKALDRRSFIKRAGAVWASSPVIAKTINSSAYLMPEQDVLKRITARISSITTQTHPEQTVVFLRNALMAKNILAYAEELKKTGNGNPRIAFNVGAGHQGIEDLLLAGKDICSSIIMAYPSMYLRQLINFSGGIEDFSSIRKITLPSDFSHKDTSDRWNGIQDEKIIDREFETKLRGKLDSI